MDIVFGAVVELLEELDELLDKVSHYGINSLSEYELSRLRQAREEMRGK